MCARIGMKMPKDYVGMNKEEILKTALGRGDLYNTALGDTLLFANSPDGGRIIAEFVTKEGPFVNKEYRQYVSISSAGERTIIRNIVTKTNLNGTGALAVTTGAVAITGLIGMGLWIGLSADSDDH